MNLPDNLTPLLYMSKVACFQQCAMKYYWSHHLNLQTKDKPGYFAFGSTCHRAVIELGLVYGFNVTEAALQLRWDIADLLAGEPIIQKIKDEITGTSEADRSLMLTMCDAFQEKWSTLGIKQVLGTEKSVKYDIRHLSPFFTDWVVKADFLFEDQDGVWVGDLKTTSGYGTQTAKYYHSSPQTKTYFYILQKMMPNLMGTKIFVLTKQKVRCEVETILLTEADKYEAELFIEEAVKSIDHVEWLADPQIAKECEPFPRSMTSCINHFGQECPYIPICIQPIKSQAYLDDVLANWYRVESPDLHLELED